MTVLCSRCGKSAEKEKFIEIGSNIGNTYISWKGPLGGKGRYCPPCAKKERKWRKQFWRSVFYLNFSVVFIILCGVLLNALLR